MKVTKQQLKKIIKEEVSRVLSEIEGLSPKEFRKEDPMIALKMARQQKEDHYSTMSCEELEVAMSRMEGWEDMHYTRLDALSSAYNSRKEKCADKEYEDLDLEKRMEVQYDSWQRDAFGAGGPGRP
jgi:hypothetical protein